MGKFLLASAFLLLSLISCENFKLYNPELKISYVITNCKSLVGKTITTTATYMGWNCPRNCKNPGITRSDTCWVDNSGCIYAKGLSGLDPLKDINKQYTITAEVYISKTGVCYLNIKKVVPK